jgi:hypothetical protein
MGTGRCGVRIRPDYEVGESSYKEKYAYCIGIFQRGGQAGVDGDCGSARKWRFPPGSKNGGILYWK